MDYKIFSLQRLKKRHKSFSKKTKKENHRNIRLFLFLFITLSPLLGCVAFESTEDYPFPDAKNASDTLDTPGGDTLDLSDGGDAVSGDTVSNDTAEGVDTTEIIEPFDCGEQEGGKIYISPTSQELESKGTANCPYHQIIEVLADLKRRPPSEGGERLTLLVSEQSEDESKGNAWLGEKVSNLLSEYPGLQVIGGYPLNADDSVNWEASERGTTWITLIPLEVEGIREDGIPISLGIGVLYNPSITNSAETLVENFSWRLRDAEVEGSVVWAAFGGALKIKKNTFQLQLNASFSAVGFFAGYIPESLDDEPPRVRLQGCTVEGATNGSAVTPSIAGVHLQEATLALINSTIRIPDGEVGGDVSRGVVADGEGGMPTLTIERSEIWSGENYQSTEGLLSFGVTSIEVLNSLIVAEKIHLDSPLESTGIFIVDGGAIKVSSSEIYALGNHDSGGGTGVFVANPESVKFSNSTINYPTTAHPDLGCNGISCVGIEVFNDYAFGGDSGNSSLSQRGFSCCDPAIYPIIIEESMIKGGAGDKSIALVAGYFSQGEFPAKICVHRSVLDGGKCSTTIFSEEPECRGVLVGQNSIVKLQNNFIFSGEVSKETHASALYLELGGEVELTNNFIHAGVNTDLIGLGSISALEIEPTPEGVLDTTFIAINNIINAGENVLNPEILIWNEGFVGGGVNFSFKQNVIVSNSNLLSGSINLEISGFDNTSAGTRIGNCLDPNLHPEVSLGDGELQPGALVFPSGSFESEFVGKCMNKGIDFNSSSAGGTCKFCQTPQVDMLGLGRLTSPRTNEDTCEEEGPHPEYNGNPGFNNYIDIGPIQKPRPSAIP